MSSIDKYMQGIASGYDRRVRVYNTSTSKGAGGCNGYINFYINGRCILTIKDRYGYISEDEKAQIRRAIHDYQTSERYEEERRRREEEERRRRAEEERRRREEEERRRREAERVAAYNSLVSSVASAKRGVESSFATVTQVDGEIKRQTQAIGESLNRARYEAPEVRARLDEIDKRRRYSLATLTAERKNKIERIARYDGVKNNLTTANYVQMQRELNSIGTMLTSATFNRDEVTQMDDYVKQLLAAQERLYAQRESFSRQQSTGGVSGEIAKLAVQQIDNVNKNSLEQIEATLTQLQQTQEKIKASNTETEMFGVVEALRNAPVVSSAERNFVPRQSTYAHIDYAGRCQEAAGKLRDMLDSLKSREYTTATQGELEHIERALQEFSTGMVGKNQLDSITSMTELVGCIQADDRLFEDIFNDYKQIKDELAKYGVVAERLDALNYESQRERLLEELYSNLALSELDQEKEEAADKRNMLAMGLRSAFADQGLYFIGGRVSENGTAEENVFAIPGVNDAVVKAIVTEDGLHWFVCGTQKEDGTVASAERVYEVMRVFDESGKPQKILNSFSQSLNICSGNITNAVDYKSPDALQTIADNGIFSLSQTFTSGDGAEVSAGQIMNEISREFADEAEANGRAYAASRHETSTPIKQTADRLSYADRQAVNKKINAIRKRESRPRPRQRNAGAARARHMR